jgi:hypothetical protein
VNNTCGCFFVTILPPAGGVPVTLWLEVGRLTECADLIAASLKMRRKLEELVHAGDPKPADVAYNTFGE